ncbi:MAG: sarcosine oxidase subunit gamma [Pseudotabrizicola sp.]|uniref:sarcosine oxidase subunit gamma n=1 Tax=Pseudotabrizicola sp. TaxID=2939647 RepID=UPI002726E4D4|nr:sarcosine oxidase subunit gamma [Pseudotabrizicola sp.]MDO9637567.1 sarcosine oxidase subunit gamma [Pseudotabrizicola sp.]
MPDLIAKPALGAAPVTHAGTTLAEAAMPQMTSIAPWPGHAAAVGLALGMAFPAPNCMTEAGRARLVWAGRDMAFLIGEVPPDGLPAAVTDQADGWAALHLSGVRAVEVLARLVPLDLRDMRRGQALRTALNHLPLLLIAEGEGAFTLLTFRSMARTAWHEVEDAMVKVAARVALTP